MRKINQIITDIMKREGISKNIELAELFNVKPNTVSTWLSRGTIPYKAIVAYCDRRGIASQEILTGEGPMEKEDPPPETKEAAPDLTSHNLPLIEKLNVEIEESIRLKLSVEELTDLLIHTLEGERIKQKRRRVSQEPAFESKVASHVRRILKEDVLPEGVGERRRCAKEIGRLFPKTDNTKDISLECREVE